MRAQAQIRARLSANKRTGGMRSGSGSLSRPFVGAALSRGRIADAALPVQKACVPLRYCFRMPA